MSTQKYTKEWYITYFTQKALMSKTSGEREYWEYQLNKENA